MSDDNYNQRVSKRMQEELREADTLRARHQAQLDRLWWEKAEAALELRRLKRDLDPYNLGIYDDDFHVLKKG